MQVTTYNHSLISDSLERSYSNFVMDNGAQPLSFKRGLRRIGAGTLKAAKASAKFLGEAINAQAEARVRDISHRRPYR